MWGRNAHPGIFTKKIDASKKCTMSDERYMNNEQRGRVESPYCTPEMNTVY